MMLRKPPVWLALPAAAICGSLPAAAQEFLTETQALRAVLGENAVVHKETRTLTDEDRRKLQEAGGLRFPETSYTFFIGQQKERVTGYALEVNEIGKSEPITFLVGMSPEHKVTEIVILAFRETRGWEVKEKRFLRQFRGKVVSDPIRVNEDIVNYAGATLSSKALARGTKRALLLLEHFYPGEATRNKPRSGMSFPLFVPPRRETAEAAGIYSQMRGRMGTLCEIRIRSADATRAHSALDAGFAELERLERIFSNYRSDSELARVNREASFRAVPVSAEFWTLTRDAVRNWRRTRGCFDVTVGPLVAAWGFQNSAPRQPSETQLKELLALVGCDKLELDARGRTIRFRRPGMALDFGGFAKGFASERVARALWRQGVTSALVNLGGSSIFALDEGSRKNAVRNTESAGWVVGLANPVDPSQPAVFLELPNGFAMSTSGTYERQFLVDGRQWSHLLDPRTGMPVAGRLSATVIARSGRRAEALTKQMLIAAGSEREALLRRMRREDWLLLESERAERRKSRQVFTRTAVLLPA